MEKKFKETSILEDFSRALAQQSFLIGPSHTPRIATVLFHGVSRCLSAVKSTTIPKAIVFRSMDHSFLAGAKVEYIANADDPSNPAAGRWDYTWTFYEDDLKGCDCIDTSSNNMVSTYFISSGTDLYNMRFAGQDLCIMMMTLMIELIINWLRENATESEPAVLTLDGVFKATATVENGKTIMGIVPDGEMKILIKDDSAIQEQ